MKIKKLSAVDYEKRRKEFSLRTSLEFIPRRLRVLKRDSELMTSELLKLNEQIKDLEEKLEAAKKELNETASG